MHRGVWWATVHGIARAGHDWMTELAPHIIQWAILLYSYYGCAANHSKSYLKTIIIFALLANLPSRQRSMRTAHFYPRGTGLGSSKLVEATGGFFTHASGDWSRLLAGGLGSSTCSLFTRVNLGFLTAKWLTFTPFQGECLRAKQKLCGSHHLDSEDKWHRFCHTSLLVGRVTKLCSNSRKGDTVPALRERRRAYVQLSLKNTICYSFTRSRLCS